MRNRRIQLIAVLCSVSLLVVLVRAQQAPKPYTTWRTMGGTADSANYSSLTQINRSNVNQLQVAWTYPTGDQVAYVLAPIVVDRTLYAAAKNGQLVAVDAATGQEKWAYDFPAAAGAGGAGGGGGRGGGLTGYRGLNYWESKDRRDRRILAQVGGSLWAIDAQTGKPMASFGTGGHVDVKTGMTRPWTGSMGSRSPGQVFENLLILGSSTGEAYGSPPADIRAFDVVTGSLAWVFHTIPHPGEFGYETWPKDAWTYTGGAANWGELAVDEKRAIVYIPVGTPKYEFWGGDRLGDTLFANCILALDARSGKRLWHYQTVHHDVWEYEMPAAPQLLTVRVNGATLDVVAQASKSGFLYVLDRATGKPVWPIEERKVPQSDVPGEKLSPTQPFPTKPPAFERQSYTLKDVDDKILTPEERARWTEVLSKARNEGIFTPFGTNYFSIMMPGHSGGANLFSTSADPETGTEYVISFSYPALERYFSNAAEAASGLNMRSYGPSMGEVTSGRRSAAGRAGADAAVPAARAGRAGGRGAAGRGDAAGAAGDAAAIQRGQATYLQTCVACHGADLGGANGAAPPLVGIVDRLSEEEIRAVIHDGRARMPAFAAMPDADLAAVVTFLQSPAATQGGRRGGAGAGAAGAAGARGAAGPPPYPSNVEVPPRQFSAYTANPVFIKPPYSSITAYDLNQGTIKWQIPDGEAIGVDPPGNNFGMIKDHGPKARLAVTAGGLAFQATIEKKIRAYDKDTGKVLWTFALPDGSEGSPAIYEVDGREYIAVFTRGAYLAFALPAGVK